MGLNEIQKRERSEFLEKNLKITECSQRKPYVFISYASDNWETVFKSAVVPMQQKYGLRVYADKAFDKVNDKWIVPMLRNVRGADMFVAFISQSYIESYACFLELLTAINNKKQLVVVTLEEKLHLGDTTSLPMANRGVKNEILNQGANIATNTNNTSNDVMRAMKSAFTSLSTLLEQDALSKYDISDAFINFLRDASLNQKTINDLKSLQKSIKSVSSNVFDPSLVVELNQKAEPKPVEEQPKPVEEQPRPVEEQPKPVEEQPRPVEEEPKPEVKQETIQQKEPDVQPSLKPEPEQKEDVPFHDGDNKEKVKKPLNVKLIGGVAAACVAVIILAVVLTSGPKQVTDMAYQIPDGKIGTYTGEWKKDQPEGQGTFTDSDGGVYEGEWQDGKRSGTGTMTYADGRVYKGEFKDNLPNGIGTGTKADGDVYEGEFKDGRYNGTGTMTYADGDVYEGEWQDSKRNGTGTYTWAD
ncbi:MAG: TIR domain-containing protein, partial [Lachnospiraceae bacterium]|nr:TIR domain-containing protein [Lachnospiraceae bacterium]